MSFNSPSIAFISPIAVPHQACLTSARSLGPRRPTNVTTRQSVRHSSSIKLVPKMEQAATKTKRDKEKKRAAPTFSTDIKGNVVWTLRSATDEDVEALYPLVEERLSQPLVELLVSDSSCCMVCEASIKGTKEGEGFYPVIMGVVLVDITSYLSDETDGLPIEKVDKHGHVVTVFVDPDFPDSAAAKKLLLGSLRKMKEYNVVEVTHDTDDPARIELLKQCLFKANGKNEEEIQSFKVDLKNQNPDPLKKIM